MTTVKRTATRLLGFLAGQLFGLYLVIYYLVSFLLLPNGWERVFVGVCAVLFGGLAAWRRGWWHWEKHTWEWGEYATEQTTRSLDIGQKAESIKEKIDIAVAEYLAVVTTETEPDYLGWVRGAKAIHLPRWDPGHLPGTIVLTIDVRRYKYQPVDPLRPTWRDILQLRWTRKSRHMHRGYYQLEVLHGLAAGDSVS